ncbi:MAG: acyl--CoA ligase [Erysipelotrichaceae bacterium]|jgi:acyl-CoA synthetase (AMP-forming)/AMP-acid ligase II|nr:acyl--CoA ligase [Erysipelotrichaceae bacterium]
MQSQLANLFYENSLKTPNKEAIWCDGQSKTYKEMADYVSQYSNLLLKLGVKYGDHIAIPMNNSIESVALFFSAADLGVCLVPLNPTLPLEAIKSAMKFGDMKHLIARKAFYNECQKNGGLDVPGIKICLDNDYPDTVPFSCINEMPTTRPVVNNINGDESLILTMTSGSTGNPKPIDISQKNKIDRAMAHIRVYNISKDDRILAATPLYHSLAERLVILPLILGATSILLPRFTPQIWLNCAKEQKTTFTIAVSAQLAQILEVLKQDDSIVIDSFRCIVSSSALLEEKVKYELIDKLKCEFHEMYGTSETSTITNICFQKSPDKQKSVGLPFDEASIKILKEDAEANFDIECNVGEVGEIACKTSLLCKGYYHQEEMMKMQMKDGYFRTGDLGYLDEDGYLYFSGRKKEIIITGAVNVYPHDIDVVLERLPEIKECAAFSYPDDRLGEVVAVALVPNEDAEINIRSVKTYCARNLADFQQPHKFFVVDQLPKNTMGKLQRMNVYNYVQSLGLDKE